MRRYAVVLGSLVWVLFAQPVMADAYFWVVGNPIKGCWIVEENPIVNGDITFSDGPYRSNDDAKLAMTTIGICKKPSQ
jgi:hypothetical protein